MERAKSKDGNSAEFRGSQGAQASTMFKCLTICTTYACYLFISISEEGL